MRKEHIIAVGDTFSFLTVIAPAPIGPHSRKRWHVRCECGNERVVTHANLHTGNTKSCGCHQKKVFAAITRRHGACAWPGEGVCMRSREYIAWTAMNQRCTNPNYTGFKNWGGRGISVCDRWRDSFENFLADVGPRPSAAHSIDRINNDGNYEPGNVRWATKSEQSRNQRPRQRARALSTQLQQPEKKHERIA